MACLFADESKQGSYIFGVARASSGQLSGVRQRLRAMVLPGQRSLHFGTESPTRRALLLDQILSLGLSMAVIDTGESKPSVGRPIGLKGLIRLAERTSCTTIVIEKDETSLKSDSIELRRFTGSTLPGLRRFEILARHEEPMLWIPDAIAWSYQRGGHFRKKLVAHGLMVLGP